MATVVNNPGTTSDNNSMGMVIGLILLLAMVFLFFYYGLPAIRQASSPSIQVPSQVDVNLNPGAGGNGGGSAPAGQ